MIRVLLCEHRELVLSGIRAVFDGVPDVRVVGHAPTLRAMPADADVALVSGAPPVAEIRAFLARGKAVPPIVLMTSGHSDDIVDLVLDGVRGALTADSEPADVVTCVRAVAAGAAMLAPPIAAQLLDRILESPEPPTALDALSDREREVLGLLAVGKSHGEIAGALSISPSTVRSHLHHVVTKLNVRHRVEAVTLAYQLGLVDGP